MCGDRQVGEGNDLAGNLAYLGDNNRDILATNSVSARPYFAIGYFSVPKALLWIRT